ncbi:MAG: lysophospholipid acyltransferase family protein [Chloracidobacterium sp.]|nr:lysophospholipid acyltransferase family protein [Chloracidobacterium sp.]MDW8218691.1 lysophospholipid acyltransferase family protein [Acidobacteriota bacterium]
MSRRIFQLPTPFRDPLRQRMFAPVKSLLERWLLFHRLNELYAEVVAATGGDVHAFFEAVLEALNVKYHVLDSDLARLPATGPVVVVANHPFGGIEGIILTSMLRSVRPDAKVMANYLLGCIPEARDYFILVDPFERPDSPYANLRPLRAALRLLAQGGAIGMFPAGEVAHWQAGKRVVTDPAWKTTVARLVRAGEATVVPVYFDGRNGALFQMAGFVHPRLRTAMLPHELLNKRNREIEVRIGHPIPWSKLRALDDEALTAHLRQRTYLLASRTEPVSRFPRALAAPLRLPKLPAMLTPRRPRAPMMIAAPRDVTLLEAEIKALPASQRLVEQGEFTVWCADAEQIPHTLHEIGRLREITFREAGEGTGKSLDVDTFDAYYQHLFVWNHERREIAGGYRFGRTDEIVARFGKRGLYTNTLFAYGTAFLRSIGPALELGRSFVRREYQKSYAPLMLLWKGIGRYIAQHPRYRVLFGPVSITNEYRTASRRLMVEFLKANNFQPQLARLVRPRMPFESRTAAIAQTLLGLKSPSIPAADIEEVSAFVADIEPDAKGVPVLLRQYLKLGGKVLAFNIDPDFGDALDGLIMVDLLDSDRRTLERYMGRAEAEAFLAYHQRRMSRAG